MSLPRWHPGRPGQSHRVVEVAGLRATRTTCRAGSTMPAHVHPEGALCLLLSGRFEESWGRRTREVEPGSVIVKPPGVEHRDRFGPEDVDCLNVVVSPEAWDDLVGRTVDGQRLHGGPRLTRLAHELEVELRTEDRASRLAAEGLLLSLVAETLRREEAERSGPERWLEGVRERLHAEYASSPSLDELAAGAGLHPAHLARRFRRRFGVSVGEYLRDLRVTAALRGIAGAEQSLAEVALRAGFSDQSHMGRVLRRVTGRTPGEWRSRLVERGGVLGPERFGSF